MRWSMALRQLITGFQTRSPTANTGGIASTYTMNRASYLVMRDGVKIALDLYLPKHPPAGSKLPAVMCGTRYFRALRMRWPFHHLLRSTDEIIRRFLANGYAYIAIDARGSGASCGYRPCPWSPDEVQDFALASHLSRRQL